MKTATYILSALFALAACAPSQPTVQFDPAEVSAYVDRGTASITGTAFVRMGNKTVTCAGDTVFLAPATDFTREVDARIKTFAPKSAILQLKPRYDDPSLVNAFRRTICDAEGNFAYDQIAAGQWYILTRVLARPEDPSTPNGASFLRQFVSVQPGETARPVLTYRDVAYRYGGL